MVAPDWDKPCNQELVCLRDGGYYIIDFLKPKNN